MPLCRVHLFLQLFNLSFQYPDPFFSPFTMKTVFVLLTLVISEMGAKIVPTRPVQAAFEGKVFAPLRTLPPFLTAHTFCTYRDGLWPQLVKEQITLSRG